MEYENATPEVLLHLESILQMAKQLQHAQFYFVISGLKIIGHGNPDNNLESHCISWRLSRSESPTSQIPPMSLCVAVLLIYLLGNGLLNTFSR
jgi:hypothetical protein